MEFKEIISKIPIKPYFKTELGVLYNADCLEIMKYMPEKSIDLVLTDPPYGINADSISFKNGTSKSKLYNINNWDKEIPNQEVFNNIYKVSNNQIIWGGNYFVNYIKPSMCWLFWDKMTGNNSYSDGELAFTSFKKALKKYSILWLGANAKDTKERLHPTQKPLKLMTKILKDYSENSDVIFDPFLGSGTTALACEHLGRQWIGVEISEKYCAIARKRIENESNQQKFNFDIPHTTNATRHGSEPSLF